jgi:hypothetical protein
MKNLYNEAIQMANDYLLNAADKLYLGLVKLALRGEFREIGDRIEKGELMPIAQQSLNSSKDPNARTVLFLINVMLNSSKQLEQLNGFQSDLIFKRDRMTVKLDSYDDQLKMLALQVHYNQIDLFAAALNILHEGQFNDDQEEMFQLAGRLKYDPGEMNDNGDPNVYVLKQVIIECQRKKWEMALAAGVVPYTSQTFRGIDRNGKGSC